MDDADSLKEALGLPGGSSGPFTSSAAAPAFLLADSRMLFGSVGASPVADLVAASLRDGARTRGPRAAYLGAGTRDRREFYEIFELFAEGVGCSELCQVHSEATVAERAFLSEADLVVIGGGDPLLAFRAFEAAELVGPLREAFLGGAVHVGVSAGATVLGLGALDEGGVAVGLLGLVPLAVATGAHERGGDQGSLRDEELANLVRAVSPARGIAIPAGAGALYHADGSLEPLSAGILEVHRHPDGRLETCHLVPPAEPSLAAAQEGAPEAANELLPRTGPES